MSDLGWHRERYGDWDSAVRCNKCALIPLHNLSSYEVDCRPLRLYAVCPGCGRAEYDMNIIVARRRYRSCRWFGLFWGKWKFVGWEVKG